MDEHSTTGAAAPGAAAGAPAPAESRELLTGRVRAALECAARDGGRAALIVVQVDPVYALKALPRVRAVLEVARRERSGQVHLASLGANRFALVAAPIGSPGHAAALAEHLTRALDPRICPLLRRALPYACSGVGLFPDHGADAEVLMAHAERSLEAARSSGARPRRFAFARRRPTPSGMLRPLGTP